MRLSLWQQFSSNNSAHFTIVGVFESPEIATNRAKQLDDVMQRIGNWHQEHPDESEELWERGGGITDVEKAVAEEYKIDWPNPVWWFGNYKILIHKQFVVVSQIFGADSGAYPINKLLEALGAQVGVDGDLIWYEQMSNAKLYISCRMPQSSSTNNQIQSSIASVEPTQDADEVFVKFQPRGFHFFALSEIQPELFDFLTLLDDLECHDIRCELVNQIVSEDEYDED